MKRIIFLLSVILISTSIFAQETEVLENSEITETSEFVEETQEEIKASKGGYAEIPAAKRPKPIDQEKAIEAAKKDDSADDEENFKNTIKYGLPSEISELLDDLIENKDPRFSEEIYDVFQTAKSPVLKEKILNYFKQNEDPCLEDFAVTVLNDPYDEKSEVVKACFQYIAAVKCTAATPAVINLLESENENYFNDALSAIGDIGSAEDALFIAEYLERDDLSVAQRQSLMRTLGKMHAVQTWDKVVAILENEDENTFVRMYAAEALGAMEKEESVPILVQAFGATDPNLRQYVIKGLSYFPNVLEARSTIVQGIRDEHWRVRQESIKSATKMELSDAIPYLIYRVKNDAEKLIKEESIASIAKINTTEGNDFLISQLKDKKLGDGTKAKIAQELLKAEHAGQKEILELADEVVQDDKRKSLRYAIGKELAKNTKPEYKDICAKFLDSKDAQTISLGLDMYKNHKFAELEPNLRKIAEDKKASANKNRAKKFLGIEDDDEKKDDKEIKKDSSSSSGDAK